MNKIKEVLRLKYLNQLSNRQIQSITGISRNSVANYVNGFIALGVSLEMIFECKETELEQLFHPDKPTPAMKQAAFGLVHPDWNQIRLELANKGMTRALLYEEYKNRQPDLYSYSQFNRYYNRFIQSINPSMRQVYYGEPTAQLNHKNTPINSLFNGIKSTFRVQFLI